VLLASLDIVWPVARVSLFAVEETANAQLFSGSSIPARPIAGARSLMPENAIEPVAVLRGNRRIWKKRWFNISQKKKITDIKYQK
jgi:hypothetical protein